MKLTIRPLTPDLWPALEDLFGGKRNCGSCWCMYWRIGGAHRNRPCEKNKAAFREVVKGGPPGLLASSLCRPTFGWGADDGLVPGVRRIAQNLLQDFRQPGRSPLPH